MATNQDYISQYSDCAVEQMQRYGIPASIILAQGMLESANGQSQLARNENNHFGVKASKGWLESGGKYGLYTDDAANEKFCSYASVSDSYEHHSKVLKNNSRYAGCFALSADDYRGWANELQKAGYASDKNYAKSLISIIERNGLDRYDKQAMQQGVSVESRETKNTNPVNYSFPVKRDEFMLVTSPFGMRTDPTDSSKQQMHKGIDIKANHDGVLATESNGKVIAVNNNTGSAGGCSVKVEYDREDGSKIQVVYCHLDSINVKVGDIVKAGQQIGISGNTGTHTTGPHLHFGVKLVNSDGSTRDVDPAAYLADIAQKGNLTQQLLYNGNDLLAKYKSDTNEQSNCQTTNLTDISLSPEEWMKKLLSSEDSGIGMNTGDPIIEIMMTAFSSLMALALSIDNKSEDDKMQAATDAAVSKRIDLTSLVPSLKSCELIISESGKSRLTANDGSQTFSHELTSAEMNRLSLTMSDSNLSDLDKLQRLNGLVNSILTTERMSRNYDNNINTNQSQTESIQIK